jgi:type VI secretion system protein ImpL
VLAGLGFAVYMIGAYFLGSWLKTDPTDQWILRGALWLLGITAAVVGYIFWRKKKQAGPAVQGTSPVKDDILFLTREASQRLASSAKVRRAGASIADLPLVMILGESGSTKTTAVMKSGLDPELLSGQDRAEGVSVPPATRIANFWLAGGAVFVEAGGGLLADRPGLAGLVREVRAAGVGNMLGRTAQAPRAIVVCCDIESLRRGDVPAQARQMRQALGDIAETWASRVPVYVLFTKLDRVNYFLDYVRGLAQDEAGQVFGVTLPLASSLQPGIYNQEQTQRLTTSFDQLFNGLTEKRCEFLRRENDPARPPNIYEFPREYRKLRDEAVRFLLEVGRPTMLGASPFLRGFYFTGVRPVANAEGRRGAQWVFLEKFFQQALLQDSAAFGAAAANTGASKSRRILYGIAAAASAIWLIGATFSFLNNRGIVNTAGDASGRLKALRGQTAGLDKLRVLDELRVPAQEVTDHHRYRPPMSHRWGLYPGQRMYDNVRELYCGRLRETLLGDVQDTLLRRLRGLPSSPGPNDDYDTPYNNLKAYLMMTKNPDKADAPFLSGMLGTRWSQADTAGEDQRKLAGRQFWFYASERRDNFCPAPPDNDVISQARRYLLQFKLEDRAYRAMIDDVNRQGPPLRFVDSTNAMADPQEVGFAFSKDGFKATQAALRKALEYLNREPWVLGEEGPRQSSGDTAGMISRLTARYQADFIGIWNLFVDKARVNSYANLKDAAVKLTSLSASNSPMIKLFCMVAKNTSVENPDIVKAFQPFQGFATPASCDVTPIAPGNQTYMQALGGLQVGVDRVASAPNPDMERLGESDAAKAAAVGAAQQHNMGAKPSQLLKDPIIYADALAKGVPAAALNGKGGGFCQEISPVLSKFPFNPRSETDSRVEDLAAVFAPQTGRLWTFYEESLKDLLSPTISSRYTPKTDAKVSVSGRFVEFFNRAAAISKLFFGNSGGAPTPKVQYALSLAPSTEIESVTLQVDRTTLKGTGSGGRADFTWPEAGGVVHLQAKGKDMAGDAPPFSGPWAIVHFFAAAEQSNSSGSVGSMMFRLKTSLIRTQREVPINFTIEMKGGAPITLLPRDLALTCVGQIALK